MKVLKEPAITWQFIGWTEDWEKEKFKDSGAVARAMFINKYKDTMFYLPDTGETFHVDNGGIQFLIGQSRGWTIYGNSDKPGVEEESLTLLIAVQLIQDTPQAVGIKVEQPMPGSEDKQSYDPDAMSFIGFLKLS